MEQTYPPLESNKPTFRNIYKGVILINSMTLRGSEPIKWFSLMNKFYPAFREEQIQTLLDAVEGIEDGRDPENLILQGGPSTGKTSSVDHIMKNKTSKHLLTGKNFHFISINCKGESFVTVCREIVSALVETKIKWMDVPRSGVSYDVYINLIKNFFKGCQQRNSFMGAILLDEFDQIVGFHEIGKPVDDILYTLSRVYNKHVQLQLTAIGNSKNIIQMLDEKTLSGLQFKTQVYPAYSLETKIKITEMKILDAFNGQIENPRELAKRLGNASEDLGEGLRWIISMLAKIGKEKDPNEAARHISDYIITTPNTWAIDFWKEFQYKIEWEIFKYIFFHCFLPHKTEEARIKLRELSRKWNKDVKQFKRNTGLSVFRPLSFTTFYRKVQKIIDGNMMFVSSPGKYSLTMDIEEIQTLLKYTGDIE